MSHTAKKSFQLSVSPTHCHYRWSTVYILNDKCMRVPHAHILLQLGQAWLKQGVCLCSQSQAQAGPNQSGLQWTQQLLHECMQNNTIKSPAIQANIDRFMAKIADMFWSKFSDGLHLNWSVAAFWAFSPTGIFKATLARNTSSLSLNLVSGPLKCV